MTGSETVEEDLMQTKKELKEAQRDVKPKRSGLKPIEEVTCYRCGEKGHYRRSCPHIRRPARGTGPGSWTSSNSSRQEKSVMCWQAAHRRRCSVCHRRGGGCRIRMVVGHRV